AHPPAVRECLARTTTAASDRASKLRDRLRDRPAAPSLIHLLLCTAVSGRELRGDVETLFDGRTVGDALERLGGAERPVAGAVARGPDQRAQISFARVRARAPRRSGGAADLDEGVADRDHALPAAGLQRRAIRVVPDANRAVDVPGRELVVEGVQMVLPAPIIARPSGGQDALPLLELRVDHRANAAQRLPVRNRNREGAAMGQETNAAQAEKPGRYHDALLEGHHHLLTVRAGRVLDP